MKYRRVSLGSRSPQDCGPLCLSRAGPARSAPLAPPQYDFRGALSSCTRGVIQSRYPQLQHLVEDGVLLVYQRPATYVERRTDGYQEPEEVFLIGTSHVSQQSAQSVREVIEAVRPETVVVELCKSRVAVMMGVQGSAHGGSSHVEGLPGGSPPRVNPFSLSGAPFLEALRRSLALGGVSALMLRWMLARQGEVAEGSLGVRAGAEFQAAREAAEKLSAQIVLGDRPIEITLARAWESLTWRRRWQLCWDLWRSYKEAMSQDTPSPEASAVLSGPSSLTDDLMEDMVGRLALFYPELVAPLIAERDTYLAWSLKRSKAVNGSRRVVGVVGYGHMKGVVYALSHDSGSLRFRDLVGDRNTREYKEAQKRRQAARLAVEAVLGSLAYWAWTQWPGS